MGYKNKVKRASHRVITLALEMEKKFVTQFLVKGIDTSFSEQGFEWARSQFARKLLHTPAYKIQVSIFSR